MSPFIASLEKAGQFLKNVTQVPAHIFWIYAHVSQVVQSDIHIWALRSGIAALQSLIPSEIMQFANSFPWCEAALIFHPWRL